MSEKIKVTFPEVAPNAIEGWNVEQFTDDGECLMAIFTGPYAEKRARAYKALGGCGPYHLCVSTG